MSKFDPERMWKHLLFKGLREGRLRSRIGEKYPDLKDAVPYMTSDEVRFVRFDEERRLLVGTLGWLNPPPNDQFWRYKPLKVRKAALVWLQEKIGDMAEREQWPYGIVVEAIFADWDTFDWLNRPKPRSIKKVKVKKELKDRIVHIGHTASKLRYPIQKPKDVSSPITRNLGGGWYLSLEPVSRIFREAGTLEVIKYKSMPYGTFPNQLELYCYNVWEQTGEPFVAFDLPIEIIQHIGFNSCSKNYNRLLDTIMDITWTTQVVGNERDPHSAKNITPFLAAKLWDLEPAKMSLNKNGTVQRRPGRRRLSELRQSTIVPSIIILNPVWLEEVKKYYHKIDLSILSKFVKSRVKYQFLLKIWELGARGKSSVIPFFGKSGLWQDLELDPNNRPEVRRAIKTAFESIQKATQCPFTLDGDKLRFSPWEPFRGRRRYRVPVPNATQMLVIQGRSPDSLLEQRERTIEILEEAREQNAENFSKFLSRKSAEDSNKLNTDK